MVYLTTDRLILRELQDTDWRAIYDYVSNPIVMQYRLNRVKTIEQVKTFIANANVITSDQPRYHYDLAIVLRSNQQLIGNCELHIENFHHASNFDHSQARIGYAIHPDYWGQGYATETVRQLLGFGFGNLNLHRIYAPVTPANTASARVLEKVGMIREGHFRQSLWMQGQWVDVWLYALLQQEWRKSSESCPIGMSEGEKA
jgi:RimJ/RimL family protein N-acetyltransferase